MQCKQDIETLKRVFGNNILAKHITLGSLQKEMNVHAGFKSIAQVTDVNESLVLNFSCNNYSYRPKRVFDFGWGIRGAGLNSGDRFPPRWYGFD